MNRLFACVVWGIVALPSLASGGVFGGFVGDDGTYLRGASTQCTAAAHNGAAANCMKLSPAKVARLPVSKGVVQRGADKQVNVAKAGSRIVVTTASANAPVVEGDTRFIVDSIQGVYLDKSSRWLAVEFAFRLGGRVMEDVLVLRVPSGALGPSSPDKGPKLVPPLPPPNSSMHKDDDPEVLKKLAKAKALAKRGKSKRAIAAFREVLEKEPDNPEALYRVAVQLAQQNRSDALVALEKLAQSPHPDTPLWRVEARLDAAFRRLRSDSRFRTAVGIDLAAGEKKSAYERLVSFGGVWEQAGQPCDAPRVELTLKRATAKSRFDLVLRSKCQGSVETTRLDGTWSTTGSDQLHLRFPNMDSADDALTCQLQVCSDRRDEDCLHCQPEPELAFVLRVVRR